MTPSLPFRILEHVHGHVGWLAAALLAHPAVLLRRPQRRAHGAVLAAVLLVTAVAALGAAAYGPYRAAVKPALFRDAPGVGWLFERKEHLAFGAVVLAWTGAAAYVPSRQVSAPAAAHLARAAQRAFLASAALAVTAALLGTVVAVHGP